MKTSAILAAVLAATPLCSLSAQGSPDLEMWRLDCGSLAVSDLAPFSDTHLYDGVESELVVSCYLIRNGDDYLLWDAGLSTALLDGPVTSGVFTASMKRSIVDQLAELEISASAIDYVGVSHYHFDHTSQLSDFAGSTLLIGTGDWSVVKATKEPNPLVDPRPFAPWLGTEASEVVSITRDHDVFGDGSVQIVAMPGHTPGHSSLVVKLPTSGTFMLTGDLYHFVEQIENKGVPEFNVDRADTLASFHRFDQMAENLGATVMIQHDGTHLGLLPAFPESAK